MERIITTTMINYYHEEWPHRHGE